MSWQRDYVVRDEDCLHEAKTITKAMQAKFLKEEREQCASDSSFNYSTTILKIRSELLTNQGVHALCAALSIVCKKGNQESSL